MSGTFSDTKKLFSVTNIVGYILGLFGLSMIAVSQALTFVIPLLFAPIVCGTLGFVVYKTSTNTNTNPLDNQPNALLQE